MASIKETKATIKALPGMTGMRAEDGEWRVTVNLYRLSDRYPDKDVNWCEEKQEALAYYTSDADDAIRTARDMSIRWMDEGVALGMSAREREGHVQDALRAGASVPLKDGRWLALGVAPDGGWCVEIKDAAGSAMVERSASFIVESAAARAATRLHGERIDFEKQERLWKVMPRQQAMAAADEAFQRELERVYGKNAGDARYKQRHDDPGVERARSAYHKASEEWNAAASAARNQETQQFIADMKAQKMDKETPARERVYDIHNAEAAETMFRRLQHQGLSPQWDTGVRDGIHMHGVTLPQAEVSKLRELQTSNPATWGNHPDVQKMLDESKKDMEASAARRNERLDALTPEQREFIEVLHYQSKGTLHVDAALDVNDRLHELSVQHHRLAQISLSESGLSKMQERVQGDVETKIILLSHEIPGVLEPKFMYDPRGTTVGLMFESGAHDSLNGSYKVPLNPARVKELANENFQAAIEALEQADQERGTVRYMELLIENTTNAAFADTGREQEVARIIEEAADKLDDWWGQDDGERHQLRDLNGNTVGHLVLTSEEPPRRPTVEGEVKLSFWCELDNDAYGDDPAHEAAQHLREAAHQITKGNTDFPIYDTNGNHVGDGTIRELPSLEKEGVIDMSAALGDVYLAEDGYSGIADGEYRYVVPTNGFEPGYSQGEGDAWLVNAKGEKAPGYEEPQTVRETDFRELKTDERAALRDVVEGRVTFEDFERGFEGDDPAP